MSRWSYQGTGLWRPVVPEWVLAAILVGPGLAFVMTAGDIREYFHYDVPDGQFLYILSKLTGLYAAVLLWLQVMGGLIRPAGIVGGEAPGFLRRHRVLGLAATLLLLIHAGLFVAAVSLRNGHFAWALLWPHFDLGYYRQMLSLGLIAAWLLMGVIVAGLVRSRLGGLWKWIHRLSVPALVLVLVHSFFIGTETRVGPMPYVYLIMAASLLAAAFWRLVWMRWSMVAGR